METRSDSSPSLGLLGSTFPELAHVSPMDTEIPMRWLVVLLLHGWAARGMEAKSDSTAKFRLTGGMGAGNNGILLEGRLLAGPRNSNLRFGVQGMRMEEIAILSPNSEDVSSWTGIVGWECVDSRSISVMPFAGGGVAEAHLKAGIKEQAFLVTTYEMERFFGPTAICGIDLGISFDRHLGISLQAGALYSRFKAGYAALQIDLGAW